MILKPPKVMERIGPISGCGEVGGSDKSSSHVHGPLRIVQEEYGGTIME